MYDVLGTFIKIAIVLGINLTVVAYLILVERKIAAFAQDRVGPNRAGMDLFAKFPILNKLAFLLRPLFRLGFLHPLVDGVKMMLKEDVVPRYVNKPLYILAPCIAIVAAIMAFAVVPFGPVGVGTPSIGSIHNIQFQIAPGMDVGLLYIFAVGSLAVYAVLLAGWSSNNKYSFLGGVRSSAQIISYEIPLGLSILGMVLLARSLDLNTIINWQDHNDFLGFLPRWGIFVQPLGFLLFLVSSFAETNRLPFDLPESEQELVAGFHTEYSAMKFGMFFLGEYLHVITVSFLVAILFLGGWDFPFLNQEQTGWLSALLKTAVLTGKVALMIVFIMWIRWTLPRFRYDQLMDLAWKTMIPLALINLVVTASILQLWRA
jgi:NADH-quinone oxidoreductase subunit H